MCTSFPVRTLTAPNRAQLLRVGACRTTGSLSSGGTHIAQREPCCWKWHSSKLHKSISSSRARRRSFFKILLGLGVCLGNQRAGLPAAESHFAEDTLRLARPKLNAVGALQVVRKHLSVPKILLVVKISWSLSQVLSQLRPLLFIEGPRAARSLAFVHACKSFFIKAAYPSLYRCRILTKQVCNFITGQSFAHKKNAVQSVVISGFLRACDFLLNGDLHDFRIFYAQPFHDSCPPSYTVLSFGEHYNAFSYILQYLCRSV